MRDVADLAPLQPVDLREAGVAVGRRGHPRDAHQVDEPGFERLGVDLGAADEEDLVVELVRALERGFERRRHLHARRPTSAGRG